MAGGGVGMMIAGTVAGGRGREATVPSGNGTVGIAGLLGAEGREVITQTGEVAATDVGGEERGGKQETAGELKKSFHRG